VTDLGTVLALGLGGANCDVRNSDFYFLKVGSLVETHVDAASAR
jgi:hypothetical protein